MCADRRKNGRSRKYHYSKIQNAGDCVARTGVREIGFKFGSLPYDPGGITCMNDRFRCLRMQRKAHQRASLCLERGAIFGFVLRLMRGSFLMPVISDPLTIYTGSEL